MQIPPLPSALKLSHQQRPRHFYERRRFWLTFLVAIMIGVLFVINWDINKPEYQKKLVDYVYAKTQTRIEPDQIRFNLFAGSIKGKGISIVSDRTKLALSLKDFKVHYSPFSLILGRLRVRGIESESFVLDTSHLVKVSKEKNKANLPKFLTHISLSRATINNFFWQQTINKTLTIKTVRIKSKAHSMLIDNPLQMLLKDITYQTPKLELRAGSFELNGLFTFDLSQPHIFDESNMTVLASAKEILLAVTRQPKPWLVDRAWDEDLEPILFRYFSNTIPLNRSYFFVDSISLGALKTPEAIAINSFEMNFAGAALSGQATWWMKENNFGLKLKTDTPLPISKLPLGQSKFRKAFNQFDFETLIKGKLTDLRTHDLTVNIQAKLLGNNVREGGGDIAAKLDGHLVNKLFATNNLALTLLDGTVAGNVHLNLNDLTTNTSLTAKNLDALTVVRLFSTVNIPSRADATGSVTGKLNNPRLALDMTTPNATYEFLNFGPAHGTLLIENKNLKLNLQTQSSLIASSQLQLDAKNVFNPLEVVMQLKTQHANVDISKLLNTTRLGGTLAGTFDLQRARGKVKANGDLTAKPLTVFDQDLGELTFKVAVNEKHVDVKPITINLSSQQKTVGDARGLAFDFDQTGYTFKGNITSELAVNGSSKKENKNILHLSLTPNNFSLDLLAPLIPVSMNQSSITGKIDLDYNIKEPLASQMNSSWSKIDLETPEGPIRLNKSGAIDYQGRAFIFKNIDVAVGEGQVSLNGPLGLENNSALHVSGSVDFAPITDFNPFISDSDKPIQVDVTLKGNIFSPQMFGKVELQDDAVRFRKMDADLEHMTGVLKFDGEQIATEKLNLEYDDGLAELSGWVSTNFETITGANLKMTGKEIPLHFISDLSLASDVDLTLTGHGTLTLAGQMNIVEGLYHRNFVVTDFIIKPSENELGGERSSLAGLPLNTQYKLSVKNTGELLVKNNLAELELNTQLDVTGTLAQPEMMGQIDFLNGRINAFGINFDEARGYAQFKKSHGTIPTISLTAQKEIQGYDISAKIEGRSDNLKLSMNSSPALNNHEILSLVLYGQTPDQLSADMRRTLTQTAAISQLATLLSDPLNKMSGLDVLQVSTRRESTNDFIQRLSVGKHLSNRFDLTFTTDIGIQDPERALEISYQMLDNLYLIVAKDIVGRDRYRFDVNWKFETY